VSTLDYVYRYPFASSIDSSLDASQIQLSTSLEESSDDLFFNGRIQQPQLFGQMCTVLSDTVGTRFYQKLDSKAILDPVVTSGGGMLRMEGFSACCGVYARIDLDPESFDVELRGKGTTNVDFNTSMKLALKQLRKNDWASLQVGGQNVSLATTNQTVIERKVKLPVRWVKGFSEVQAYHTRLIESINLSPADAIQLFRSFPPKSTKATLYIVPSGKGCRLAARQVPGAIRVDGVERLKIIEPLLQHSRVLAIWYDEESQVSCWEVRFDQARYFNLISPELNRGFSGEGQMLTKIAAASSDETIDLVANRLQWQSQIDCGQLAIELRQSLRDIENALAALSTKGLAGFDLKSGKYFHRVLPFDADAIEKNQPRLIAARLLIDHVEIRHIQNDETDAIVSSGDDKYFVRLRLDGDRCNCMWWSRHQGSRGPCKHVLAVKLKTEATK
jgi:hypothetical protein